MVYYESKRKISKERFQDKQLINIGPIIDYNKEDGYLEGVNLNWKQGEQHELKLRCLYGNKTDHVRYNLSWTSYPFYLKRELVWGGSIYDEEGLRGKSIYITDNLLRIIRMGLRLKKEELYKDDLKNLLSQDKKDIKVAEFSFTFPFLEYLEKNLYFFNRTCGWGRL